MTPMDFVKTISPFEQLDASDLAQVEAALTEVHFAAGQSILIQDGVPSQYLYLIREGAVRMEREEHNGVAATVMVLEEGECFGYPSMIGESKPAFTVIAEEATLIYQLPENIFRKLLDNQPFAEFFLRSLSERLRETADVEVPRLGGNLTVEVGSLIRRPAVFVPPTMTVADAARTMNEARISSVLIEGSEAGIVTDRDLRNRILAVGRSYETPIEVIMSYPLKTLPTNTLTYNALLFMLEQNIYHLPLTQEGKIIGVITNNDLLRHQTTSPFYLLKQVEQLDSLSDLKFYFKEVAKIVGTLHRGGLEVVQIARIVSNLNDTLISRIISLVEQELGTPPTPYAWIVFGSEGREEQTILTDQDNALIYEEASSEADSYFKRLAKRVGEALLKAGFPPCPGGYMAINWCRPLADWLRLFESWIKSPEPQALLEASIFFDFRSVHGSLSLNPLERLLLEAGDSQLFLGQLARATLRLRPPLGFFRRIREENGHVDLKKGGIAPIVGLARLYALQARSRARSTLERIEAARQANSLSQDGADTLAETFRFLLTLRLRDQLTDLREGRTPDNRIRMREQLSARERRHLKEAFVAISSLQSVTSQRYQTSMLG